MMKKQLLIPSFIIIAGFFTGCSAPPLKPLPYDSRESICINVPEDLTGEYSRLGSAFDSLCLFAMNEDFIEGVEPIGTGPELHIYQNPLRSQLGDCGEATYKVRVEVERIAYEPVARVNDMIMAYHVGGWLGAELYSDSHKGDMAGLIQYRLFIADRNNVTMDSFVTIGVSLGKIEEVGRKQLMLEANTIAAYQFASDVFTHLKSICKWELAHRRIYDSTIKESARKLMNMRKGK